MHHAIWDFSEINAFKKTNTPSLVMCSEEDVMFPFLDKVIDCRPETTIQIIQGKNLEPDLDAENIALHLMEFYKKN